MIWLLWIVFILTFIILKTRGNKTGCLMWAILVISFIISITGGNTGRWLWIILAIIFICHKMEWLKKLTISFLIHTAGNAFFRFTTVDTNTVDIGIDGVNGGKTLYQPYDWIIDWGDGEQTMATGQGEEDSVIRHDYKTSREWTITIYSNGPETQGWFNAFRAPTNIKTIDPAQQITSIMRTMNKYSHYKMFSDCRSLTKIPEGLLPATILASRCYENMFSDCRSLTTIPEGLLPAMTLAEHCYDHMFYFCDSLTGIPEGLLPAMTLSNSCYEHMFQFCRRLKRIPEGLLPATTLVEHCYDHMFSYCESLTKIPEGLLPATTLVEHCYDHMFSYCICLTKIPVVLSGMFRFTTVNTDTVNIRTDGVNGNKTSYQSYDWIIDWGDGLKTVETGEGGYNSVIEHTYAASAEWTITIYPNGAETQGWFNAFRAPTNIKTIDPAQQITSIMRTMNKYSHFYMFISCHDLTEIPEGLLPATTLAERCYDNMFWSCDSLTGIPEGLLPATTLADGCYARMFQCCRRLKRIPEGLLPATTLAEHCYDYMFSYCESLTEIPEGLLPAMTLATDCYEYMFCQCESLIDIGDMDLNWFNARSVQTAMFEHDTDIIAPITYDQIPLGWKERK